MIFRLFGKKPPQPPGRDVRRLTDPLSSEGVHVVKIDAPALSHFGGEPSLPSGLSRPTRGGVPLAFLARLSLAELQRTMPIDWLPGAGALLFFYDFENQPWGFDPQDRGSCAVVHVPDLEAPLRPAAAGENSGSPIPFRTVGFRRIRTRPSSERPAVEQLNFTDAEMDDYSDAQREPFQGMPQHQVCGFPAPVQADAMELECQLVTHGLYCGDSTGYDDPRAAALGAGATDWRLLFQFDSDDELNIMWGDCGMIYFWVRSQDARQADFSNTWLILQCA